MEEQRQHTQHTTSVGSNLRSLKEENEKLQEEILSLVRSNHETSKKSKDPVLLDQRPSYNIKFDILKQNDSKGDNGFSATFGIKKSAPGRRGILSLDINSDDLRASIKEEHHDEPRRVGILPIERKTYLTQIETEQTLRLDLEDKQLKIDTKRRRQRILIEEMNYIHQEIKQTEKHLHHLEERNIILQRRNSHLEEDVLHMTDIVARLARKAQELQMLNSQLKKCLKRFKKENNKY